MSGLYLVAGALIGSGILGVVKDGTGWGGSIAIGTILTLIAALCEHYQEINS